MNRALAGLALLVASPGVSKTARPWTPLTFPVNATKLSPEYVGDDAARFAKIIGRNSSRDEFETTAAFHARTRDFTAIKPIDPEALYAFKTWAFASYDADKEAYVIEDEYACSTPSIAELKSPILLCGLGADVTVPAGSDSDYVGENAYGAKAVVSRIRGAKVSLAVNRNLIERSGAFIAEDVIGNYKLEYSLPMPIKKARRLRGNHVAVLFVGKVSEAKLIEGRGVFAQASISDPTDIAVRDVGIPFDLSSIVFYVFETGEVLKTVKLVTP